MKLYHLENMCRKFAIKVLEEKGNVIIRCNGRSMIPIIYPKEAIHLKKVQTNQLRIGDAVFCKINNALQVHLITAIVKARVERGNDTARYQISNNHGYVNGWIKSNNIFGLALKIEDRILVSDEELEKRLKNDS